MKLRSLLSIAAMATSFSASAQWINDSVSMNAGYINDVYYSLQNGTQGTAANTNWHLGFQVVPQQAYGNVSVIANHVQGGVKVYSLNKGANASWSTLTATDTVGKTGTQLYNSDTSWNYGAFNHGNPSNVFDYGWGTYNMTSHNVEGDSIYLLKVGTAGTPYKFSVSKYVSNPVDSVKWVFRIAALDGSGDTTISIRPADYPNRMFAYYNVTTRTVSNREPVARQNWDLLFTRYVGIVTQGPTTIPYNLTGVLSNFGVTVADVRGVNPDTARYFGRTFTRNISEIGSDWKTFNMAVNPPRYDMDTTATFFIHTNNTQEYWQIKFTGFDYTAGKVYFSKRYLGSTSAVNTINRTVAHYYATPVPANNQVSLMVDTKEKTDGALLFMTDLSGRTVYSQLVTLNNGMNVFTVPTASLPAGMYVLSVAGSNIKLSQKITVAH